MLPCVCSVIDHRGRCQNVLRTSVTHSAAPRVPLFCCSRASWATWQLVRADTVTQRAPLRNEISNGNKRLDNASRTVQLLEEYKEWERWKYSGGFEHGNRHQASTTAIQRIREDEVSNRTLTGPSNCASKHEPNLKQDNVSQRSEWK